MSIVLYVESETSDQALQTGALWAYDLMVAIEKRDMSDMQLEQFKTRPVVALSVKLDKHHAIPVESFYDKEMQEAADFEKKTVHPWLPKRLREWLKARERSLTDLLIDEDTNTAK